MSAIPAGYALTRSGRLRKLGPAWAEGAQAARVSTQGASLEVEKNMTKQTGVGRGNGKKTIACQLCQRVVSDATGAQKYCVDCSEIRARERTRKWAGANKESAKLYHQRSGRVNREAETARLQEAGTAISRQNARSIAWYTDSEPEIATLVRVAVPFHYGMSKNRLWSMSAPSGHVFMRQEIKDTKAAIAAAISTSINRDCVKFQPAKIWIDLLVQKPNHRGDAVNVLDLVCDALKEAIGVDDRWFSIRRLDWEVVKDNPMIFIGIGQEDEEERRVCSYCGQQRTIDNFTTHLRVCDLCRIAASALNPRGRLAK